MAYYNLNFERYQWMLKKMTPTNSEVISLLAKT
ncbi:hypothetical protein [Paenibacillus apiarius]|nr:hypothetical protein [Paenibacillus apiarius]